MDWFVVGWIVIGLLALAYELLAMLNKRSRDTLSEQIWRFLGFYPDHADGVWLRRLLFAAFFIWLGLHLFFRIS